MIDKLIPTFIFHTNVKIVIQASNKIEATKKLNQFMNKNYFSDVSTEDFDINSIEEEPLFSEEEE